MIEPTIEDLMSDIYSGIGHRSQHDDFAPARIAAERLQARLEAAEAELARWRAGVEAWAYFDHAGGIGQVSVGSEPDDSWVDEGYRVVRVRITPIDHA